MVLLQLKDPLELFGERREFLPGYGFLSYCDTTYGVESNINIFKYLVILCFTPKLSAKLS